MDNITMAIAEHTPSTGQHRIQYCGDTITFTLKLDTPTLGKAWLRTNIGHAQERRQEIIEHVEKQKPLLSRDWHDIPMHPSPHQASSIKHQASSLYTIKMPLAEVGRFQAKAFFIPEETNDPQWPDGKNVIIKVEPASTVCGNSVYSAFVRQFGPNMAKSTPNTPDPALQTCPPDTLSPCIDNLDSDGYTVIPKSGTFRNLIGELDHIINTMGFNIVQLLPIHPVPTTYARMGRFGSPFASIDFFDVDPALAEFDRKTTPLDQFAELVDGIHTRNASIFLDLPINHTGWASQLQMHHPEWFARDHDSSFSSPGAWGVTWEDLSELDYAHIELWQYMADVFLFWCRRGVDGFRCDAGYMVPLPVWEYITAKVRQEFPNTIFLLEGLGGDIRITQNLLDQANLNWAYSEIFQTNNRSEMESYLPHCLHITNNQGTMIHFAETHDNNRLANRSIPYARMRTALAALLSEAGAFGITNGVEWFATSKVDVHSAAPLNWGAEQNQIKEIAQLNKLLNNHPAFMRGVRQKLIQTGTDNAIAFLRSPKNSEPILIVANLDDSQPTTISWNSTDFPSSSTPYIDLLTNKEHPIKSNTIELTPSQILCLSPSPASHAVDAKREGGRPATRPPNPAPSPQALEPRAQQASQATALALYRQWTDNDTLCETDATTMAKQLKSNPAKFCETITNAPTAKTITTWQFPQDLKRNIMLPYNHTLLIRSQTPFRATLAPYTPDTLQSCNLATADSLKTDSGEHIAFLTPPPAKTITPLNLHIACSVGPTEREDKNREFQRARQNTHPHQTSSIKHQSSPILQLPSGSSAEVVTTLNRKSIHNKKHYALLTNNRGAISQIQLEWGKIESQYDCILGANLNDQVPVDRHIAFTRCRAWLIHRDYSQAITTDCIQSVTLNTDNSITWLFVVPVGMGKSINLKTTLQLIENQNRVELHFERIACQGSGCDLDPTDPITLLLRPDIEDRNFHETTKAHSGPEHNWPKAVKPTNNGFSFSPSHNRTLDITIPNSTFTHEAEWEYGIPHTFEAQRGLNNSGDLFSPGYFQTTLSPSSPAILTATVSSDNTTCSVGPAKREDKNSEPQQARQNIEPATSTQNPVPSTQNPAPLPLAMKHSMKAFIVKRDQTRTVIAGYPWFLDWGRDTLICLRGIIAAGMHDEAKDILIQFAGLEDRGTIPNMIRGNDDSNRDTSDAPLWFFTACADLVRAIPCGCPSPEQSASHPFLDQTCKGRTIRQILTSIANNYITGTPNGIKMDPETALIFSPSHYTWMDTNHPAGTPREGYPIEIQALWFAALKLMSEIDDSPQGSEVRSQKSEVRSQRPETSSPNWQELSTQVQESIKELYTLPDRDYLADCLHASPGTPAKQATPDNALRPNQLFAITLGAITDTKTVQGILTATEKLLIPGAIRSLADQPVSPPLPVYRDGQLLNDPQNPYWGYYGGDEDTRRKPAYHNGTAWTWPFPSYCEALYMTGGEQLKQTALSILSSSTTLANNGCIGHIPEILDADTPHEQRGCGAQAWGETELYRVLKLLE